MDDYLKTAHMLKKEANTIVEDSAIVSILRSLGEVHFVGSYALNLMARRDIDIIVLSNNPTKEEAIRVTGEFMRKNYFQNVGTFDSVNFETPYPPNGYAWELIHRNPEMTWKFDVWYSLPENDESISTTEKYKTLLNENNRKLILEIKHKYLIDDMLYGKNLYGAKIYKFVLEERISSVEEFDERIHKEVSG